MAACQLADGLPDGWSLPDHGTMLLLSLPLPLETRKSLKITLTKKTLFDQIWPITRVRFRTVTKEESPCIVVEGLPLILSYVNIKNKS